MDPNPYAVETTAYLAPQELTDAESIRKRYLAHEASVKSIGALYILGGGFSLLLSMFYIVGGISWLASSASSQNNQTAMASVMVVLGLVFLAMGSLQLWLGIGVRKLKPYARIGAAILSGIGLIGFPIGTLVSAYFLYLLLSEKGVYVFSDTYKQVIVQTPHMKYRTSILVWIVVALLGALVIGGLIAVIARAAPSGVSF